MNAAHLHLIIVHAAPALIWAGLFLFVIAWFFPRERAIRLATLIVVLGTAVLFVLAANTGESAMELLHEVPGVSDELIHEHEDLGELMYPLALAAAFIVLVWFTLARRDERHARGWSWWVGLVLLAAAAGLATWTANRGGAIRHPESTPGWEVPVAEPSDAAGEHEHGAEVEDHDEREPAGAQEQTPAEVKQPEEHGDPEHGHDSGHEH